MDRLHYHRAYHSARRDEDTSNSIDLEHRGGVPLLKLSRFETWPNASMIDDILDAAGESSSDRDSSEVGVPSYDQHKGYPDYVVVDFDGPHDPLNPLNCTSRAGYLVAKLSADVYGREMEKEVDRNHYRVMLHLYQSIFLNYGSSHTIGICPRQNAKA